MISLYSGTPGSGKSLHIAQKIYNNSRWKRPIIANFPVNTELLKNPELYHFVDNQDLVPELLIKFSEDYFKEHKFKEGSLLLIIDEAQLVFNVREWNLKGRNNWIHFFTQHRKLGYDVIVVAQFDRMIDKQLRSLFEYEYIHRKISNFGLKGKMLSIWTGNRLFVAVQRWYPLHEKVGVEYFTYKKHLGELYNTKMMFEKPDTEKQQKSKKEASGSLDQEASDDEFLDIEVINI